MPLEGPMLDRYGRVHNDLRISVTDRCNLRCVYCMPEEGLTFLPKEELLSFDEIARLAGSWRAGSASLPCASRGASRWSGEGCPS